MENIKLKDIIEETIRREVKRAILENTDSKEVYIIKNKKGEPIEVCQTQEEAEEKKLGYEEKHPEQELIIEPGEEPTFDELDAMSEKLDNMENIDETKKEHKGHFTMEQVMKLAKKAGDIVPDAQDDLEELCEMHGEKIPASRVFEILDDYDMPELKSKIKIKKVEPKEGNAFTGALAKAKKDGDDSFTVDGKEFDVEEDMSKEMDEHYFFPDTHPEFKNNYFDKEVGYYKRKADAPPMKDYEYDGENWNEKEPKKDKLKTPSRNKRRDDMEEGECYECGGGMSSMEEENEVCEKCGQEMCECGSMYESKKSVRLTEAELVNLISQMVNEAVPGLTTFEKAHKESGSQNDQALSDVEKKIKQYLTFDGNDNPEFPGHNEGDVEARQSTGDEADEIADNRGGGLEDLDYDVEPSDKFKERLQMSLKGDTKMGNAQKGVGNVIPSDLGEKMMKKVKRKKEAKKEAPMYVKDPSPSIHVNESKVISEEINRMKEMFSYNKKTQ